MKKTGILSVFLALTFLVNCLTGCGENASEEMSGSWRLISYTADGQTYDEASLAQYGIYITMTLSEDGTGVINTGAQVKELTWDSRSVKLDGVASSVSIKDGLLYMNDASGDMIFRKGDYTLSQSPMQPVIINGGVTGNDKIAASSDNGSQDSRTEAVEWETYSDENVSFELPKGWKVSAGSNGTTLVYSVYNPDVQGMGWQYAGGPLPVAQNGDETDRALGVTVMREGTAAAFYEGMFGASRSVSEFQVIRQQSLDSSYLSALGNELDHSVLYAQWVENGMQGEGVYHAIVNGRYLDESDNKDGWYYIYDMMLMTAPKGQLESVLNMMVESISTLTWSDAYAEKMLSDPNAAVTEEKEFRKAIGSAASQMKKVYLAK